MRQVIHSEGERKAAKALTEAALLLEQNSACLPLRYLQVWIGSLLKDVQQVEYEKAFFILDVAVGSISISNANFFHHQIIMNRRLLPFHNRFKIVKLVEWLHYVKGLLIL